MARATESPWYSTINCPGNFVAHRPNGFYFTSDFAPTTVDFRHTTAIATLGPAGPTVLSTADVQPNFDAGTRTMGMRLFGCYRLEGTYWARSSGRTMLPPRITGRRRHGYVGDVTFWRLE